MPSWHFSNIFLLRFSLPYMSEDSFKNISACFAFFDIDVDMFTNGCSCGGHLPAINIIYFEINRLYPLLSSTWGV